MADDPAVFIDSASRMHGILARLAHAGNSSDEPVFRDLIRTASETLRTDYAFIGELIPDMPEHARMLEFFGDGAYTDGFVYCLDATPCRNVVKQQFRYFPRAIQSQFPDPHLRELQAEAYAAIPLFDSRGNPIGLMGVMSRSMLPDEALTRSVLGILSVRAAAELERRDALEARQHSEASYRAILESAEDAAFVHDIDTGAILDVNSRTCDVYGYTREELLQIDVGMLSSGVPPYTMESAVALIERAKAGETVRAEWHRRNKDGSLHWDEVVIRKTVLGGHARILVFTRDVTERKRAEQALRTSEEQYRAIFNASVDGMALWSLEGQLVDVNPAFARMHGFARDEMPGMDPHDFIHLDSLHHFNQFLESLRARQPFAVHAKGRHKDGSVFEAEVSGVPIEYGGVPHMLSIARDITLRLQQEAALRKSEERLRATVEAGLDCIISMDAAGQIIGFNPAAEACFGYHREQVLGRPLAEMLIPERYREQHRIGLLRHRDAGDGPFVGRRVEVTARRADGSEFPAELAIAVAHGPDNHIFVGFLRDITDVRTAEQERLRLETQLRQAQKMEAIGHLSGGIAHDFNNILTGVMGYIGMAQERLEKVPDEALNRYMDRARHAVERARDLIQQMLTFSRGQRGAPQHARLAPLVRNAVRLLEPTLSSGIEIRLELATDLPPVSIDPVHLEQVLMNLCINARDAMQNHGRLHISVSRMDCTGSLCRSCLTHATGAYAALTVRDAGSGIEAKNLERLFEPFFTTKEIGKGSGMGLAVVHGIVHEHGGHILLDSEPGKGTSITVLFPLLDEHTPLAADVAQTKPEPTVAGLKGRILLVDDDGLVRGYMRERLNAWGLQVDVCSSGAQALAWFEQTPHAFDVAILDQTMPKMTGIELAQRLYITRPDLPVLLYTGYVDARLDQQAISVGIHTLLKKPVDNHLLLRTLQQLLV
jgi:PAS domain S-box-containing protein